MDAVGTVIKPHPSVAHAYQTAGRAHGIALDRETIRQRFHQAISKYSVHAFQTLQGADDPLRTDEKTEIARWRAIVNFVLSPQPEKQDDVFRQLWDHFGQADNWQLFEDVSPALSRLKDAGFRLGLASNFDHRLRPIAEQHLSSFDLRLFISSEVGWVKPAAAFYERVTRALDCGPDEILLIGDDWENDVQAPQVFGWQALYLDRSGKPGDGNIPNSYKTLGEAVDALLAR
ncbi:HAD-IA family hydrolase [Bremerella sp. P1]|uniref:HAD-IA family hydrolase n=1 Tax=Bremerella sp. P1 TaxID=3026424 RepID=UPI00236870E7|nr:HAD-IA family hydrolase [Bremerella sp. P1]WDI40297.1 HAD-IA family hydrolase [Bremerella sp. P1]